MPSHTSLCPSPAVGRLSSEHLLSSIKLPLPTPTRQGHKRKCACGSRSEELLPGNLRPISPSHLPDTPMGPSPPTPAVLPAQPGVADRLPRQAWSKQGTFWPMRLLLARSPRLTPSHRPSPRAPCRSSWTTCSRPCSARCTGAVRSPWPSSTCLTSWTSRRTDTASMTRTCGTPGRATGKPRAAQGGLQPGGACGPAGAREAGREPVLGCGWATRGSWDKHTLRRADVAPKRQAGPARHRAQHQDTRTLELPPFQAKTLPQAAPPPPL